MSRTVYSLALAGICAVLASAQVRAPTEVAPTSSSVAYVYVSSSPRSGKFEIQGYNAAATGKLTGLLLSPVPDSIPEGRRAYAN